MISQVDWFLARTKYGLGVKAARKMEPLEILWVDPAVSLSADMTDDVAAYAFEADRRRTVDSELIGSHLLVFGLSSFANHSDDPNCDVKFSIGKSGPECVMFTLKPIEENEELFISYADIEWYYENGLIAQP